MRFRHVVIILFVLFTISSVASAKSYVIDDDNNLWIKGNFPVGTTTIYINQTSGYSPNGDAVFLFWDNFTNLNTTKWTQTLNSSATQVINSGVLEMYNPTGGQNWSRLQSVAMLDPTNTTTEFRVKTDATKYSGFIGMSTSASTFSVSGAYIAIKYQNNSGYTSVPQLYDTTGIYTLDNVSSTAGTWENITIYNAYHNTTVTNNGVSAGSWAHTNSAGSGYHVHIGAVSAYNAAHTQYVDWFRIRKYSAVEPTVTYVGTETIGGKIYQKINVTTNTVLSNYQVNLHNLIGISSPTTSYQIYQSNSVTPLAVDAYTVALLHFDGGQGNATFADETGRTWTAHDGVVQDESDAYNGLSCGIFNRSNSNFISTPASSSLQPGNQDFTIEFAMKLTQSGIWQYIFGSAANATLAKQTLTCQLDNNNYMTVSVGDGTHTYYIRSNSPIGTTGWHNYSVERHGSYVYIYMDGTEYGRGYVGNITIADSNSQFVIGFADGNLGNYLNGSVDEFRYSIGIARNTVTTPVTPKYAAFGDSITLATGQGDLLPNGSSAYILQYVANYDPTAIATHNLDGAGQRSSWGANVIYSHFVPGTQYICVMFGVNDELSGAMTAANTAANLTAIYNVVNGTGTRCIIMMPTMMVYDNSTPARVVATQQAYISGIQDNLTAAGVPFVKTYDAIDSNPYNGQPDAANASYYATDGVHPNATGQLAIANYLTGVLQNSIVIDITAKATGAAGNSVNLSTTSSVVLLSSDHLTGGSDSNVWGGFIDIIACGYSLLAACVLVLGGYLVLRYMGMI